MLTLLYELQSSVALGVDVPNFVVAVDPTIPSALTVIVVAAAAVVLASTFVLTTRFSYSFVDCVVMNDVACDCAEDVVEVSGSPSKSVLHVVIAAAAVSKVVVPPLLQMLARCGCPM